MTAGAVALLTASSAFADPSMTFTTKVDGTWSDPVLSGNVIDAATGVPTFQDNSTTAACSLAACPRGVGFTPGADTLAWGVYTGAPPPALSSSTININGHFI